MLLSEKILNLFGWRVNNFIPPEDKYILIVAPHTSFMDFVIGKLAFNCKRIPAVFFIKKEFFVFPIRRLLKRLGGMPIDRSRANGVVEQTALILEQSERMAAIITPEGTRKRTEHWKKGFYYLARRTGYPVYVGKVDYAKKSCDVLSEPLNVDRPFEEVMADLSVIYKGVKGKYPKNFNF